jgi:GH18 family chitinase
MLVGYLPGYNGNYGDYAKSIDFSKMTHINFAFVDPPQCSGSCTSSSDMTFSVGQSDQDIATFIQAAHAAGVKVLASIGGGGGDQKIIQFYNQGLSDPLVASLDGWISAHDLDGVDLDIEDPGNMGANYATFVQALVGKFRPEGKLITAAVAGWIATSISQSDQGTFMGAVKQFDFVNDMHYSANMNDIASEMGQWNLPMNRVNLGVPFYAQNSGDTSEIEYSQLLQMYPDAWQTDSSNGWSYVGEATMAKEVQLGKQWGGIMMWELTGDAPAPHSLLTIVQNNL